MDEFETRRTKCPKCGFTRFSKEWQPVEIDESDPSTYMVAEDAERWDVTYYKLTCLGCGYSWTEESRPGARE